MELVYKRCCGLDIHKKIIVACCVDEHGKKEIRSFGTMTDDLIKFCRWLKEKGSEIVAMESTASYWKPIYNLLEVEDIPAMLVNAQHIKNVPGRKTDVKDSEWIADLLRHGLLKPSLVPKRPARETKELVRYRTSLIEERAREYNRLDKVLQGANIKLSSVASRMDTKSGMEMIKAIARGECSEDVLASMAKGTMKTKKDDLIRALKGYIQPHQQEIIGHMLSHIEFLSKQIEKLDEEIDSRMSADEELVRLLDEIPGVGKQTAQVLVSEIGTDMSVFPSAKHLTSWAGVCPGNNESAGKKKRGKTRKGNKTLKKTLVQCGRSAARKKDSYFQSMYSRIAARRGANIAAMALARSILEIYYYMARDGVTYCDLGADHFVRNNREDIVRRSVRRIEALGYRVIVSEEEAIAS